jgi:hypothetical protein
MTLIIDEANDGVTSVGQAKKLFAPTVMRFVLDGVPLETRRLPVKPFLKEKPAKAYVLVQGRVVAPGEPAAGSQALTVTVENDPVVPEVQVFTGQFFIDAAGTGPAYSLASDQVRRMLVRASNARYSTRRIFQAAGGLEVGTSFSQHA